MGVLWINLSVLWSFLCQKRAFGGRKQLMDYGKNIRENSCFPSPWLCSLKSPFQLGKWHRVAQAKAAPPPHSAQVWGRKSGHNCKVWNPNQLHLLSARENAPLFFKLWIFLKKKPSWISSRELLSTEPPSLAAAAGPGGGNWERTGLKWKFLPMPSSHQPPPSPVLASWTNLED